MAAIVGRTNNKLDMKLDPPPPFEASCEAGLAGKLASK